MTQQWTVPAWLLVLTALALGLLLLLALLAGRRAARASAELRTRLTQVEQRLVDPAPAPPLPRETREYTITCLGDGPAPLTTPAPVVAPAVFADTLLREGAVQSLALLHGLRRALAPEARNRIRFAVRQEVKRSRRTRRAEERAARREWQARRRAQPAREDAA